MAPIRTSLMPLPRRGISTRSNAIHNDQNIDNQNQQNKQTMQKIGVSGKRKAELSPSRADPQVKRAALGNLTNAVHLNQNYDAKKPLVKKRETVPVKKTAAVTANQVLKAVKNGGFQMPKPVAVAAQSKVSMPLGGGVPAVIRPTKVMTRAAARASVPKQVANTTALKPKDATLDVVQKPTTRRISNEFEKTEDSLYMSALEDFSSSDSLRLSLNSNSSSRRSSIMTVSSEDSSANSSMKDITLSPENLNLLTISSPAPPKGVADFDKENWDDPFQVSHYAMDIFQYLKEREPLFAIPPYMHNQVHLSRWMRTLLVDWMVEVQETFELNHETLYLAVKIVDIYLGKIIVVKDKLQLLGAASLFIACKYDERTPPLIDDFIYICDNAYNQNELIKMEMDVFRTIGFDLGIPLSYRFLRRYARCAKVPMPILTLARYILEFSLMDYATITLSDSQLASAALFIAMKMNNKDGWDKTLEYYSGYKVKQFANVIPLLNNNLHQKPRDAIKTVRHKYSHKIFYEVAKLPLLKNEQLFEGTGITIAETSPPLINGLSSV